MRIGQKKSCTTEENNMQSSMLTDLIMLCLLVAPFFILLGIGCFLADWLLPRCPRLIHFLEKVTGIDLRD